MLCIHSKKKHLDPLQRYNLAQVRCVVLCHFLSRVCICLQAFAAAPAVKGACRKTKTLAPCILLPSFGNKKVKRYFFFCISATTLHVISSCTCSCFDVHRVVAKKEASLRKRLKFFILFCKPDDNSFLVCTIISEQRKYIRHRGAEGGDNNIKGQDYHEGPLCARNLYNQQKG